MIRRLAWIIIILILLASASLYVFWNTQESSPSDTITTFEGCVQAGYPMMESYPRKCAVPGGGTFTEELAPVVGDDKDENGCIGSAGYSWCAPKQKCLRTWEESCFTSVDQEMQYLLAAKYGKSPDDVFITITKQMPKHVAGGIKFSKAPGTPGGLFLGVKINNIWQIVYNGNGSIDCEKMRTEYKFPSEILSPNYCD